MTVKLTVDLVKSLGNCSCCSEISIFENWLESKGWSSARFTARNVRSAERYGVYALGILQTGAIPSCELHRSVCTDLGPWWACYYARFVDCGPRDSTRRVSCQSPATAQIYAFYVDKCPRDDTREASCASPLYAYLYALFVDHRPRDDTRDAACRSPKYAYMYAMGVDGSR